ncbi:hypothetical protein D7267_01590 [Legionella pneumophila]|uniref:hypothetical protein n=1 Tax=Legionella pneumophila TaxID=446 RepID=UPI00101E7B91|nr:hypothetical protein [Legionella pneumophila]RYX23339.1 hypothetical protein D8B28_15535 [Legionella pneumophila]RYX27562.1 hypothetical protein D7267_01590 [Legionella pneumophila]
MRVLVTARDVGAALNIIEIVKILKQYTGVTVYIYAQPPASKYFLRAGIQSVFQVPLPPTRSSNESNHLLSYANQLIDKLNPDIILSGLSSPGEAGIDEAIIAVCPAHIKTFILQDFWGEVNFFFEKLADCYLCIDHHAAEITKKRFNAKTRVIGSPRHAIYQTLNIEEQRNYIREHFNITQSTKTIGLFGQALHGLPGYMETISQWLEACLQQEKTKLVILYRPHPRESEADKEETIRLLNSSGLEWKILSTQLVEESLLACDLVCSFFSNCLYDAAYLNYFSLRPILTPVVLNFHPQIKNYTNQLNLYEISPYRKQELAFFCEYPHTLAKDIDYLLSSECSHKYWLHSKVKLEHPTKSLTRELAILLTGEP